MVRPSRRCNRAGKVIFERELDAKLALAQRVWKDKGEVDYYPCENGHWHLTSQVRDRGHEVPQVIDVP
jgi:hypothetical protein